MRNILVVTVAPTVRSSSSSPTTTFPYPLLRMTPTPPPPPPPSPPHPSSAEISFHALAVHLSPQTLRVDSSIADLPIQILIGSGSTHNFLQECLARHLNFAIDASSTFSVTVGNGDTLHCPGFCVATLVTIADHTFPLNLFILPIHGANLVLSVQWLKELGPATFDYSRLSVSFIHHGQLITLTGRTPQSLSLLQPSQICRGLETAVVAAFNCLDLVTPESPTPTISPDLQHLLSRFDTPSGLPLLC